MKKKLLSVLMAGALVATSSVNAFAAPNVTGLDNKSYETDVQIEGNIANQQDQVQAGTLSVTVPTAATFNVNKEGVFAGTEIEIQNHGTQDIDVFAYQFIDRNGDEGIKVMKESELGSENRTRVSLKLEGNESTAYFATVANNSSERGVYSDPQHQSAVNDSSGHKVAKVNKNSNLSLKLLGKAGSNGNPVDSSVQDTFTLRLKIAKSTTK